MPTRVWSDRDRPQPASVASVTRPLTSAIEWFGEIGLFAARVLRASLRPRFEWREFLRQLDDIGAQSAGLVALAGAAIGVVISLETRDSLVRFGAKAALPSLVI